LGVLQSDIHAIPLQWARKHEHILIASRTVHGTTPKMLLVTSQKLPQHYITPSHFNAMHAHFLLLTSHFSLV